MYGGSTTMYRSHRHHKETDDIELNERSLFKLFAPSLHNTPSLKIWEQPTHLLRLYAYRNGYKYKSRMYQMYLYALGLVDKSSSLKTLTNSSLYERKINGIIKEYLDTPLTYLHFPILLDFEHKKYITTFRIELDHNIYDVVSYRSSGHQYTTISYEELRSDIDDDGETVRYKGTLFNTILVYCNILSMIMSTNM